LIETGEQQMTENDHEIDFVNGEKPLPRRDWLLMPLIMLATVSLLVIGTVLYANHRFTKTASFLHICVKDYRLEQGARSIPNSVCYAQEFDTPLTEYKWNECGHRSGLPCHRTRFDNYRIVMVGSSATSGFGVPEDRSLAALLPGRLSERTGKSIEVYNESMVSLAPYIVPVRMNQVFAAKPDMILWMITPFDVGVESLPIQERAKALAAIAATPPVKHSPVIREVVYRDWNWLREKIYSGGVVNSAILAHLPFHALLNELRELRHINDSESAAKVLFEHYLYEYESPKQYIDSALARGDSAAFLRQQYSQLWLDRLDEIDRDLSSVGKQAQAAGVPLVVFLDPDRAQAAMISTGYSPGETDPYKIGRELRSIVARNGGIYVDVLPDYRDQVHPEQGFYAVNGHPNPLGHEQLAGILAKEMTNGSIPALAVGEKQKPLAAGGR